MPVNQYNVTLWKRAKEIAEAEGRKNQMTYVQAVYKRLLKQTGKKL